MIIEKIHMLYISKIFLRNLDGYEDEYWAELPVVHQLLTDGGIEFSTPVTFLVGENGIGKSTLIEALAVNYGFNPEGGSRNFNYHSNDTHSSLSDAITVAKTHMAARDGYFLRAESIYGIQSYIDNIAGGDYNFYEQYGGKSLHLRSHGEAFITLAQTRFRGKGLYILDEPESALSPSRLMTMMARMKQLVDDDSQFIISTHSPILMAFPGARILQLDMNGAAEVTYHETEHYMMTKYFLNNTEQMLKELGITE